MAFFDIVQPNFFSVFTSPNRLIYFDALMVLRMCYKQNLLIRKDEYIAMLISNLENRMYDLQEEDDGWEEENISARAHFLVRKFIKTGWLEKEEIVGSFEDYLTIPDYANKFLQLLADILEDKPKEYNSYVRSTYAILKNANQERDDYLYEDLLKAHEQTLLLKENLQSLLNNMRRFYNALIEQDDVKNILAEHFDRYQVLISEKIYHPLKTFDSIPRFRTPILQIIRQWSIDEEIVINISQQMIARGRVKTLEDGKLLVFSMLNDIQTIYENIDTILREIDKKNTSYTRATLERLQYLLNTDRSFKGKLISVLRQINSLEDDLDLQINLFNQSYLDNESLYKEPKRKFAHISQPLLLDDNVYEKDLDNEIKAFKEKLINNFSRQQILEFIREHIKEKDILKSEDIWLTDINDFIKILLASLRLEEKGFPYKVEFEEGYVVINGYRLPKMKWQKRRS